MAPMRRQHDRAERVDVRDRVEREPARLLGGAVTEPERDDAVADLVQDDRDDEAAEVDDGLFVEMHERGRTSAALRRALDAEARRRHRFETRLGDAPVARLALAVGAVVELGQRVLDVGERLAELPRQRLDLTPLGGDLTRVGEVLVEVEVGVVAVARGARAARGGAARSSWSWSRNTVSEVSAMPRVYRRVPPLGPRFGRPCARGWAAS